MTDTFMARWPALRPWLGAVIRLVLGGIWIWAALSKLSDPRGFTQAVRAYQATPEWLAKGIGYGLPVLELIVGVLLVVGLVTRIVAAASGVLFVVFLIGLVQAAIRGIQLSCGCFGGGGASANTHYTLDILRDLVLLALAAYLVVWSWTRFSVDEYLGRHDHVEAPSAKRMRSDQGRRKYEAEVATAQRRARSRDRWVAGSLAGVVVLVCLIGIGVQSSRAKIDGTLTASHASVSDGIVYGKKAAATVDVYEDFQCPNCENFEKAAGAAVIKAAQANRAQIHFYPIDILNSSADGFYSERAENAALCASDLSVDDFVAFHRVLYGKIKGKQVQPAEGSGGVKLTAFTTDAKAAGITGNDLTTFQGCVSTNKHQALVEAFTEHASELGVSATPTIKVNGKSITATKAAFESAVAAALKSGPKPDPSSTPPPSTSVAPSSAAPSTPTASRSRPGRRQLRPRPRRRARPRRTDPGHDEGPATVRWTGPSVA